MLPFLANSARLSLFSAWALILSRALEGIPRPRPSNKRIRQGWIYAPPSRPISGIRKRSMGGVSPSSIHTSAPWPASAPETTRQSASSPGAQPTSTRSGFSAAA
jgi:hypothetical protein